MSSPSARHKRILDIARGAGRVLVEELAEMLAVTPQTIRKDLNDLCARNMLTRVHGGALYPSGTENIGYEARRRISEAEKRAIGRKAASVVPDRASLFINIGTTTEEVARALLDRAGLLVITNNLNVVDILCRNPEIEIIVVGGRVRHADRAAVGAPAVAFISQFKVDYAVIGTSAIDHDGTLLDYDINEVQVARAIVENARSVILVADSEKLGRAAPVRIGHISEVDVFVTDHLDSGGLRAACDAHDVQVIEALPRSSA